MIVKVSVMWSVVVVTVWLGPRPRVRVTADWRTDVKSCVEVLMVIVLAAAASEIGGPFGGMSALGTGIVNPGAVVDIASGATSATDDEVAVLALVVIIAGVVITAGLDVDEVVVEEVVELSTASTSPNVLVVVIIVGELSAGVVELLMKNIGVVEEVIAGATICGVVVTAFIGMVSLPYCRLWR